MFGNAENGFPVQKEYIIATIADTISKHSFSRKYSYNISLHRTEKSDKDFRTMVLNTLSAI